MCVKALKKLPGLTCLVVVVLEEFETYEYARRCTFKVDSFFYRDPDEAKDQETDEGAAPVAYFGVADRISNDQWVVIPNGKVRFQHIKRKQTHYHLAYPLDGKYRKESRPKNKAKQETVLEAITSIQPNKNDPSCVVQLS
ncbi:uncharacterized protein LOC113357650 isoform X2 [Papaver somniferum]|uniref:uncharacterized protein LOC113357650 isoform X2 n=1 Tax=Papaver somniferum TaxID=3469 RepID=UPI000E6FECF0|nr:uncharacterized protein LOC113357650 isoform X2 [Papaver somniferum]